MEYKKVVVRKDTADQLKVTADAEGVTVVELVDRLAAEGARRGSDSEARKDVTDEDRPFLDEYDELKGSTVRCNVSISQKCAVLVDWLIDMQRVGDVKMSKQGMMLQCVAAALIMYRLNPAKYMNIVSAAAKLLNDDGL